MLNHSVWIVGPSRSGKTTRLVEHFLTWVGEKTGQSSTRRQMRNRQDNSSATTSRRLNRQQTDPGVLIFAANDDNRRELADRMVAATGGKCPVRAKTPLGFFQDEVVLFWPLLIQLLSLKAQFPVRLRPETEQELATQLWRSQLGEEFRPTGLSESRLVRRLLDLLQLAAYSGTSTEEIYGVLETGLVEPEGATEAGTDMLDPQTIASLLLGWRRWCLERGLLTYGLTTELYWQHLLPAPDYQRHLTRRYKLVLADDVDDYPGVARHLFDFLLSQNAVGAFTYNPEGAVRLGLGADPDYLQGLQEYCQVETLTRTPLGGLAEIETSMVELVDESVILPTLPSSVQSIQTTPRGALLRQTAQLIVRAVELGQVQPQEVAIIAPGLDAIARYTLVEILSRQGVFVESLNDQRPLFSSPIIRALLTLLALVYPGLGRLVDRDAVAEMLVVLSRSSEFGVRSSECKGEDSFTLPTPHSPLPALHIDPVRAGLIADYCFQPHPEHPNLLPVTAYERWDRLGYEATTAYGQILQWLQGQRSQQEQRLIPSPISLLDRAIQRFLWNGSALPYEHLAALRELLETAQHYWEVDARLRQSEDIDTPAATTIAQFIGLLRRGTVTANPYPIRPLGPVGNAVTLATIFQYRSSRGYHRWQFWLDAGSTLWLKGGAATLFGAPLFLQERFGRPWTAAEAIVADRQRLRRILQDLLGRVGERVYLCHSDLAVNGQEQTGPLLSLVNASMPVTEEVRSEE